MSPTVPNLLNPREALRSLALLALLALFLAARALAAPAEDPLEQGNQALARQAYAESVPLFRQALEAARKAHDGPQEAQALTGLATALQALDRPGEAADAWEACLRVHERLGSGPLERTATLLSLSTACMAARRSDRAVQAAEGAAAAAADLGDLGVPMQEGAWMVAAAVHVQEGRWQAAVEAYGRALAAADLQAGHPAARAMVLSARGPIVGYLGDLAQARRDLEEARDLYRKAGDRRAEAGVLVFLARTLLDSGARLPVRKVLEDLLALRREAGEKARKEGSKGGEAEAKVGEAQALLWLAVVESEEGRAAAARDLLEQARALLLSPVAQASPNASAVLEMVLIESGRWEEALQIRRGLVARARREKDPRSLETALRALAYLEFRAGHPAEARRAAEECSGLAHRGGSPLGEADALYWMAAADGKARNWPLALAEVRKSLDLLEKVAGEVSERGLRVALVDRDWERYGLGVDLCFQAGRGPEGFEFAERGRARSFLDSLTALPEPPAVPRELLEPARDLLARMEVLYRQPPGPDTARQLARLQEEYQALMDRLAASQPEAAALRMVRVATLDEVRREIPADTVLVEFFTTPGHVYAWALTRDAAVSEVLPGDGEALSAEVRAVRQGFESGAGAAQVGPTLAGILAFLERHGAGKERMVLVPHGALHYLPFSGLPVGGAFLGERWTLSCAPSASVWRLLRSRPAASPGSRGPFAGALGDAVPPEASSDGGRGSLGPLPGTVDEVRRVAEALPGVGSATGRDFTHEAVVRGAGGPVLHLATHGLFDPRSPGWSRLVLADHPLAVLEILNRALAGRVVVLSACDTAVGPLSRGDEIVALHRAFLGAGARWVVASLWAVSDEATADLMASFYRHLAAGADPDVALARAQAEMRQGPWPDPAHWAGWVVVGAP